jgi:hypothetical protein
MQRQILQNLIDSSEKITWHEREIHSDTTPTNFDNIDYVHLKKEFEHLFVEKFLNYKLSSLEGIDQFTTIDTIIGCTQYIDNLYQSHPKNLFVFENEFVYHKNLRLDNEISPDAIISNSHLLISVPQAHSCAVPEILPRIIKLAEEKNCSLHLDLAWWTVTRGLHVDLSSSCIKTLGTSLSKPFSLSKNRIGIRMSRADTNDAVSIQNKKNIVPRALLELGLSYLQQHDLDYMWKKYGKHYDLLCNLCRLRPLPVFFMAREIGKKNVHINKALEYIYNNKK